MDRDTTRDSRLSRPLDEAIGSIKGRAKVWIIVHISESIVIREKSDPWRWDLLVWIEIPVVVVDVILSIVEDITIVESRRHDTPWESSIGSDLITILVEYYISRWILMSEEREDIRLMIEIGTQIFGHMDEEGRYSLHPLSLRSRWISTMIG
jgi:hypothetical protein